MTLTATPQGHQRTSKIQQLMLDLTLGVYDSVNYSVIMAFGYGSGRVFIIGTHPEFEEDSDRDGFPPDSALDDMGSDWELMKNAAQWCTGQF